MTLIDTVQLQETSSSLVELFEITLTDAAQTIVYLSKALDEGSENLYFQDSSNSATLNEYIAVPIDITGVQFSATGASSRPTLKVANIVSLGRSLDNDGASESESSNDADESTLISLLDSVELQSNDDLLGSTVVYRTTLLSHVKKASDSDFDEYKAGSTGPTDPVEFPSQTFIIERVASEDNLLVEFELASPFDIQGRVVPAREAIGRYCSWEYQGIRNNRPGGCSWYLNSDGRYFDVNDNVISKTSDTDSGVPTDITEYSQTATFAVGDIRMTVFRSSSSTVTFNPQATSIVNTTNNSIDIGGALNHGAVATYSNGGGTDIGGLTNGTKYFISTIGDTASTAGLTGDQIAVSTSDSNFDSETVVSLTNTGAGTAHSFTLVGGDVKIWKCLVAHGHSSDTTKQHPPVDSSGRNINPRYWQRLDVCGKTLNSCKIRFQGNNSDATLNSAIPLPFGGFPGLLKFR